jgi:hypothetical protein
MALQVCHMAWRWRLTRAQLATLHPPQRQSQNDARTTSANNALRIGTQFGLSVWLGPFARVQFYCEYALTHAQYSFHEAADMIISLQGWPVTGISLFKKYTLSVYSVCTM